MRDETEHLVDWLTGRDVACPVCNYNLRDLHVPRCPECSAELKLAIASPSLGMGPWIVSVVSAAPAVGFDGVVSILIVAGMVLAPPPPSPAAWMTILLLLGTFVVLTAMSVAGVLVAYRSRRRWAFWTRERQWWTAIAVFVVVAGRTRLIGLVLARWAFP